jgi:hypothetical protein
MEFLLMRSSGLRSKNGPGFDRFRIPAPHLLNGAIKSGTIRLNAAKIRFLKRSIKTLKERFHEEEERDNELYNRGAWGGTSPAEISNDAIRSMFGQLGSDEK